MIDSATGEVSPFYSPEFAREEAKRKTHQQQSDFARRRIRLKDKDK